MAEGGAGTWPLGLLRPLSKILTILHTLWKQWEGGLFTGTLGLWFYTLTSLWTANVRGALNKK